jgi:hypothetical protein
MNAPKDQKVQKVASVAPATVTQVSRQVLEPVKRKYNRRESAPAPELHTHIKVDERVMEVARNALASDDNTYTTVEIIDAETVILR